MGACTPSLRALCRGILHLIVFAILIEICQARGRDPKKRDDIIEALTSLATTDGTTLSLSASERRGGRVVTSIVTTHILVTLPCDASELPSSLIHQPVTSSPLNSLGTTRDLKSSLKQPWHTTVIYTAGSSSLKKQNTTTGNSATSTRIFNGTTTTIKIGVSTTGSNRNSSTLRSAASPTFSRGNATVALPVISVSPASSLFTSLQGSRQTEARSTSVRTSGGDAFPSFPINSTQGGQPKSGDNEPSTSALQASLSIGSTAQTSRVTTTPGQAVPSSANSRAVGTPSDSTKVTGKDPSLSSTTAGNSTIANLPQTTASGSHGTDRDVPTSSMSLPMSSGTGTHEPITSTAPTGGDQPSSKTSDASGSDQSKSTKPPEDNDDEKSTKASPGSTPVSGATSSNTASPTGQPVSPTSTARPGSSETNGAGPTSSLTSSEIPEYAMVLMTATTNPPEGVDPKTTVTWTSTEITKTTTREGIAWPTIFPVWFCGGGQLLCAPKCLIPFLSCGGIDLPGPRGFPWAKPPPQKPKGKPRKVRPDDPTDPEDPEDDPEPSGTPTSRTSSEASCTASTTLSPHCDQHCFVSPVTTSGSSTSFTTTCNTATCKPTVVCSKTLDTTTTTTFTTHSATPTPTEQFCGDRGSSCVDCGKNPGGKGLVARQHGFIPWNPAPDPDLLNGPQGLTRHDAWPQGAQNWWDRMWNYVYHYCDGLTAPRLTLDGDTFDVGYSTMHADVFGDKPLAGATGPFWGCSGIIIITKRGIYTSHVWEIPNFTKGTHNPTAFDWDAEFDEGILQFLRRGSGDRIGGYKGIEQLKQDTPIFDDIAQDTLAVILHVPSDMILSGTAQFPPNYGDSGPRHSRLVNRWADYIVNDLGFPRDKIRTNLYVKGPSYWPAYSEERKPGSPMERYKSPYGLLHWQYHPSHVAETRPDGAEVRKPTIRVWYEKFLVFEESWCPPGTVEARDNKGAGSCPMPSAPAQSSPTASGGSASASASVSGDRGSAPTSANSGSGSSSTPASAGSPDIRTATNRASTKTSLGESSVSPTTPSSPQTESSLSKVKATVWRTATAEITITSWTNPTSTALTGVPRVVSGGPVISRVQISQRSNPLPSPSYAPSKRIVRITQDMAFGDNKVNHTAVVTVYEVSGDKETILVSERDSRGGGPVELPSRITVEDQDGGRLNVKFLRDMQQIELESNRRGRTERWTLWNIKDEKNPNNAYCEVRSVTPGEGVLKRSIDCFYNT